MNQDQINRDRLLTEVHSDMKHIVSWAKKHDVDDNDRFASIHKDIDNGKKVIYGAAGVIVFIEFITKVIK